MGLFDIDIEVRAGPAHVLTGLIPHEFLQTVYKVESLICYLFSLAVAVWTEFSQFLLLNFEQNGSLELDAEVAALREHLVKGAEQCLGVIVEADEHVGVELAPNPHIHPSFLLCDQISKSDFLYFFHCGIKDSLLVLDLVPRLEHVKVERRVNALRVLGRDAVPLPRVKFLFGRHFQVRFVFALLQIRYLFTHGVGKHHLLH